MNPRKSPLQNPIVPRTRLFCAVGLILFTLSGCARAVAVERVKMGDAQLSCAQLLSEIQEADKFRKAAEDNKGVTGTNAAAVLLFWPALFMTYADANEAIRAADERKANLTKLYSEKNCEQASR